MEPADGPGEDPQLYAGVRRFGSAALTILVVALGLYDAVSPAFTIEPVTLGLVLSGALLFSGIRRPLR